MRFFAILILAISSGYSAITVTPTTLGNLFLPTEAVSIPFSMSSGTSSSWTAKDYWGTIVSQGVGSPVIPGISKPGWYSLEIKELNGATLVSTMVTSFAIVSPFTISANDSRFGVHTHFAQAHDQSVMPLLAKAGIMHIRDEQYWANLENPKDVWTWPVKFTDYMAKATANGITPFICLTWGNPAYDFVNGSYFTAPYTDNGRLGYANYALHVLDKYPQVKEVEGWNEYNAGTFIVGPATANKPLYYKQMIQKVYETIKPTHPTVKVVAGATVPVAHGFFQKLFAAGAMPYLDAVSVHYPSDIEVEIQSLRDLIKSSNGGQEKPIWVTEFTQVNATEADRYPAASYVAQTAVRLLSQGVDRMYYYLSQDDGTFPLMGLVGFPTNTKGKFRPHPAFISYSNVIRQLGGAVYQSRYSTPASIYAFKFLKGGQPVSVFWSNNPVILEVKAPSPVTVTDMMGGTSSLPAGRIALNLTKDVQYVSGDIASVRAVGDDLLADSITGYSKIAGDNGWSYGYAKLTATAAYATSAFLPMTWAIWGGDNYRWMAAGGYPFATSRQMHPSGYWAVRRWVSNYAGAVRLEGSLSRGASGDGVGIRIFVDGNEVHNQSLAPNQKINYSVPATLAVGSKVDFTVNCKTTSDFDATGYTSQVIQRDVLPEIPVNLHIDS